MQKLVLCLAPFFLTLISCNEKLEQNSSKVQAPLTSNVIVHDEYAGPEPTDPNATAIYEPKVPVVTPAINGQIPSDAIVLFDGTSLIHWMHTTDNSPAKWHLNNDGSMTVADRTGNIRTKEDFGSYQLHVEWKSPLPIVGHDQLRANSGILLSGLYEIQILDSNTNDTYINGQVGALYKQSTPLAMASVPTGEWNTYDIIYHQPEFNDEGAKTKSGTVTLLHNGILVLDHTEIKGMTTYIGWPKNPEHGMAPIVLQDHGDNSRVSFRNIWVREL